MSLQQVVDAYFPAQNFFDVLPLDAGHINHSYRLQIAGQDYLLQRINPVVFKQPRQVIENQQRIERVLLQTDYPLQVPRLLTTAVKKLPFFRDAQGYFWRINTFISDAASHLIPADTYMVEQASRSLALFNRALIGMDAESVYPVIPGFHNSTARFSYFLKMIKKTTEKRLLTAHRLIEDVRREAGIFYYINQLDLPKRIVHNDPKLSNLLFDKKGKVLAIIDWDTVMPGTWLSDYGDLVRSLAATAAEDEADLDKVTINTTYLKVIEQTFLEVLGPLMQPAEREQLPLGPQWIILEQLLRFLTDYLAGDIYYRIDYPEHNLVRARNQWQLYKAYKSNLMP